MPARPDTVVDALARALAVDPGRPFVTFYDGSSGERVELSVTTFDNWVSKIANLFADELMLDPGNGVGIVLPTCWQSTVVLLGAWTAGLRVTAHESDVDASVVGPDSVAAGMPLGGQVVACSLRPLAAPFTQPLPAGWLDFASAVPSQPDALLAPVTVEPDDVALVTATTELSHRSLVDRGVETATEVGMSSGGRLLTDTNPADPQDVGTALVAPLVSGGSVVLVTNCDEAARRAIAEQERVTCTVWSSR
jgi:uncharacterized protein (TIGR03089 family)